MNPSIHQSMSVRRNGKIARLPKETREMVNHMLDDGLPYKIIIEQLGEAGAGLNPQNLTNWKRGGYQEWLDQQEFTDRTLAQTEHALELLHESNHAANAATIAEACNMVGTAQLMQAFMNCGPDGLGKMLADKPDTYVRILNLICRLANSGLRYQKHHQPPGQSSLIKPNQAQSR